MFRRDDDDAPPIPRHVVEYLKRIYPDNLPPDILTLTDREIGKLHGIQLVIRKLVACLSDQEETVIVPT